MVITSDLKGLFKQFCDAYGIEKVDENDKVLVKVFFEWLYEEKHQKDSFYRNYLEEMDPDIEAFNIDGSRSMEIGKTVNDSIVLPYETKIVTPFKNGFENYGNRVIVANLRFHDKFPVLFQKGHVVDHVIPIDQYNTVLTQNPYSESELNGWEHLPFNGKRTIVGVYGDINDYDRDNKIRMLKEYYERLDPRSMPRIEHVVDDYDYASIVTTRRSVR